MKITYLANARIPTEKAHGIQIMKMCQAFVKQGSDLELVVAMRFNPQYRNIDPFDFYSISKKFKIKRLLLLDMVARRLKLGGLSVLIQNTTFALSAFLYLAWKKQDILYTRDQFSSFLLMPLKKNIVYEMHTMPKRALGAYKVLFKRVFRIVAITHRLKLDLIKLGVNPKKIIVAHDGVNIEDYEFTENTNKTRQELEVTADKKIVMYVGHLYEWKGVYTLAQATSFLPDNVQVVYVGGTRKDIKSLKTYIRNKNLRNITIKSTQPHNTVPRYLQVADVLLLPNSAKKRISRLYTSPIKLFEYMASKRPIVASRLPSIEEILDDTTSELVEPDDVKALADGIKNTLNNSERAQKRAKQAWELVHKYTWDNRARSILDFIE